MTQKHIHTSPEEFSNHRHPHRGRHAGHHGDGHHRRGRRGDRFFEYGELRLLILAMISEQPSYGYELMKTIEERFGGSYSPSPGVIYPTLSWLDDMGYVAEDAEAGNRKRFRITDQGQAYLVANREAADALLARAAPCGHDARPAPIIRAMENLKLALRLRFQRGSIDQASAETIAAALDAAAQKVEQS